ncbi:MAG: EAL domain-containing protein [Motiliproteus sp.]|nr:EAL domain-containing protein [Motiliproteus sp.]MCW9051767.1 EAL domain-containing protein [Motiliproteus sp.]
MASLTVACCVIAVVSAALFFQHSYLLAQENAKKGAEKTSELLASEFETYLQDQSRAAELLSGLPQIVNQLQSGSEVSNTAAVEILNHSCTSLQASICYVMDLQGTVTVNNTNSAAPSLIGNNYGFRPYFKDALVQGSSVYMAMGVTTRKRGIYFSNLVRSADGKPLGVAVIKFPPQKIESKFNASTGDSALINSGGVIFASTRPEWLLKSLWTLSSQQKQELSDSRQFGDNTVPSLNFVEEPDGRIGTLDGTKYLHGSKTISMLPGWKVIYLQNLDIIPFALATDRGAIISFVLLFMVTTAAVLWLYRLGSADINRRLSAENDLQQSEERLKQLIEISNEAILIHHHGNIIDSNVMAEKMFGFSREELNTRMIWEMLASQSVNRARNHYQQNYELPYEVTALHHDGHTFPIEICAKTSYIKGKRLRVTCIRDITDRKEQEQKVLQQAHYDSLTGLPNRNLMFDRMRQAIKKAHRHQQKAVVMFVDLDDFKKINDTLGHSTGDQLLIKAGKRLQSSSREGDTLSRYGGDEFILILEDIDCLEDAEVVAEKMLRSLSEEFIIGDQSLYISGSIGIAVYPEDGEDVDQLLQKADTAMYCSKDEGRNTYHFYTPKMNEHVRERLEMEHHLRNALSNNEFDIHYQPIYCANSGKLLGAEALIRWSNKVLGQVGPDRFIPLAEQTGLILPIGEWVMYEACKQTRKWLDLGVNDFYISVNFSPRQFRCPNLIDTIKKTLNKTSLPPNALCIEITEGLLVKNDQTTDQVLATLKQMGIQLSLDDFGTGYSALSYLKRFPFDNLKIDRSFVRDLVEDDSDRKLIQATIAMSEGLGLKVIAEGVETPEQLAFLKQTGCYAAQGYLLGKPMAKEALTETILQTLPFATNNHHHSPGQQHH